MTMNLIESVTSRFSPDDIQKAATAAGQSPGAMRTAMMAAVPTIFAGLTQAASTEEGASRVFGVLGKGGEIGTGGALAAPAEPETGQGKLASVVGERKLAAMNEVVADHAGLPRGASAGVMSAVFSTVAGVLGREVTSRGLDARGLSDLLFGQKKAIMDSPHTPRGLASALGIRSLAELGGSAANVEEPAVSTAPVGAAPSPSPAAGAAPPREGPHAAPGRARGRSKWAIALPLVLIAGLLAAWGIVSSIRQRGTAEAPRAPTDVEDTQGPAGAPPPAPTAEKLQVTGATLVLPGGRTVTTDPNGPEAALAKFLANDAAEPPRTFEFETLSFETGSAALNPNGETTIANVAQILNAYPSARIVLEGGADPSGSPEANATLSEGRAAAVRDALVKHGVDPSRIEAKGEAAERPTAHQRVTLHVVDR